MTWPLRAPPDRAATMAQFYDLFNREANQRRITRLLDQLEASPTHGVLEIAAGTGVVAQVVAHRFADLPVIAVEPSPSMRVAFLADQMRPAALVVPLPPSRRVGTGAAGAVEPDRLVARRSDPAVRRACRRRASGRADDRRTRHRWCPRGPARREPGSHDLTASAPRRALLRVDERPYLPDAGSLIGRHLRGPAPPAHAPVTARPPQPPPRRAGRRSRKWSAHQRTRPARRRGAHRTGSHPTRSSGRWC